MVRNSTRHPICEFGGGGLKRTDCQLVDWMFLGNHRLAYNMIGLVVIYLKMIITDSVILIDSVRKDDEGIPDKKMRHMLRQ